jgi:hypothetical protein
MKAGFAATFWFIVSASLCAISSCGHYIDKATTERSVPVMQGTFDFYADSNVLVYKSKVALTMDAESYKPKAFYVKLPKGLKWYTVENSQTFVFYYGKAQAVVVLIDLFHGDHIRDSDYVPTNADIKTLISKASPSASAKYDIKQIEAIPGAKQLIRKRGAATILLYNIPPGKYEKFITFIDSLKFL